MKLSRSFRLIAAAMLVVMVAVTAPVHAIVQNEASPALDKLFMEPEFYILNWSQPVTALSPGLKVAVAADLLALGVSSDRAFYDRRAGALNSLILARPLVPGSGVGNRLSWTDLGLAAPTSDSQYGQAALAALSRFVVANGTALGVDPSEFEAEPTVGVLQDRRVAQIHVDRVVDGVPVRFSSLFATLNSGNLVLLGTKNWGAIDVPTAPSVIASAADATVAQHLTPYTISASPRPTHLELIPQANGSDPETVAPGNGYVYRLAWVVTVEVDGVYGTFEGLVDAHSGKLMALTDINQYLVRRAFGGIFPVSNDGTCQGQECTLGGIPDGIEQPRHPMPFATVSFPDGSTAVTNTAGLADFDGPFRTALSGPYVNMVDTCGFIDEGAVCTDLDLGVSGGTDCETPAFSDSLGNTHSSRTGFYELNRMIELFRSRIGPGDPAFAFVNGLPGPVTAEMNIDQNCNANFNPTTLDINFFTSGSVGTTACRNTGEIAAVFDHEWGHFMDFVDGNGLSSPSEAYGDIAGIARLNDSCVGRGFFLDSPNGGLCTGFGNTCTECSGVRDDDFLKKIGMLPSDVDWASGNHASLPGGCTAPSTVPLPAPGLQSAPCGGSVHCNGMVPGEAFVDLYTRDLRCQGAGGWENVPGDGSGPVNGGQCAGGPPTMDANTALELATLMFVTAKGNINQWFVCNNEVGGCGADSGYHQFLAADDDNGSFADGTPHHEALFAAFNRHQIACPASAPPVINTSCPLGTPARVQNLTASAGVNAIDLQWDAVAGATEYWVYRTEGVLGCSSGKKRIAVLNAVSGTSYTDVAQDDLLEGTLNTTAGGLLDGLEYFYTVLAAGTPGCLGDMSQCVSAIPGAPTGGFAGEASVGIEQGTTTLSGGDGDEFLDNCESASIGVTVANDGGVDLTNVQVVAVQATSPAGVQVTINTPLPIALGNLDSVCGQPGFSATSINFTVDGGLSQDDTLILEVSVLADEFSGTAQTGLLFVGETESDFETVPEILYDFEDGPQGWSVAEGTFDNTSVPPPGAETTLAYMASSSFEDSACDKIRSPKLRLTSTSTLSLFNQFVTEFEAPGGVFTGFYDRANVGLIDQQGVRTLIEPDGGREYNAFTSPGSTYEGCNSPEIGWATDPDFQDLGASWDQSSWSSTALDAGAFLDQTVRIEVINATDSTLSGRGFWFDQVRITDVMLRAADGLTDTCDDIVDPPDEDCDLCVNGKPSELTLTYRGGDCSASDNSQGAKADCEDFAGPPPSDAPVYIISDDDSDGEGDSDHEWFRGDVFPDQAFTLHAENGDKDDFGSKVFVHIFDFEGGSLLQTVEIHTSCSAPLIEGERFGSVETGDAVNPGVCEGPSTPSGRAHGSGYLAGLPSGDDDSDSDKLNFSFDAKFDKGALKGKLKLKDKTADVEIDANQIDSLTTGDGTCNGAPTGAGAFEFTATGIFRSGDDDVEGATFRVCGEDNGKHGKAKDGQPADRLYVECLLGCSYETASRTPDDGIDGGNIHLHDPIVGPESEGAGAPVSGGSVPSDGDTGVLDLGPMLSSTVISGVPLVLTAQLDRPLGIDFEGVAAMLHWRNEIGLGGSVPGLTDSFGETVFVMAVQPGTTEYWVTVGELESNRVEFSAAD